MASHKLKIVETRHELVVAQQQGGSPVRHTVPMSMVRFHGEQQTLHPQGLGGALWWDDDTDTYHDAAPEDRPPPELDPLEPAPEEDR